MSAWDVVVVGAGAAGMFCAGVAGRRGLRVLVIDHSERPGEKIRISGGGRCNFTNRDGDRIERYASADPAFARHALRAYRPADFIALVRSQGIGFHEKHRGQLFCDDSSERIVSLLRAQADAGGVQWRFPCPVTGIQALAPDQPDGARFLMGTGAGEVRARALVIATGGLAIPKIGATDFGLRIARQFGHRIVEPRPALVPLTFDAGAWAPWSELAGVSMEVGIRSPAQPAAPAFTEDLLFTHRGLSGPAVLQISTFWMPGQTLEIDLAPGSGDDELLRWLTQRREQSRQLLGTALGERLPRRVVALWLAQLASQQARLRPEARLAELGNRDLQTIADSLRRWPVTPAGSEGYRKAEAMSGGVATAELDPRTMQSRRQPGLYLVGEVVDVTGWLGGYNFQWAWSSGHAAAQAIASQAAARQP